jgi:hypothetical protein
MGGEVTELSHGTYSAQLLFTDYSSPFQLFKNLLKEPHIVGQALKDSSKGAVNPRPGMDLSETL